MVDRVVEVETGLDQRAGATLVDGRVVHRQRRARTRFVDKPKRSAQRAPELGDPWCPLTVQARLERLAEVFRKIPHTPDTKPQQERSCMPTPVREVFKDQPGEPMRIPVGAPDRDAAMQGLDSLVTLTRLNRIVAWSIANRIGDTRLGRYIRRDRRTAATLKQKLLAFLVSDWQRRGWSPDAIDVSAAREFIHRKFD